MIDTIMSSSRHAKVGSNVPHEQHLANINGELRGQDDELLESKDKIKS